MANSFKRAMALTLAAAMVATAVPATNFGTINADAASYKITGTTAPFKGTTYNYKLSGVKKGMKVKVKVTGTGKSKVVIKSANLKGASKKVVATKKYNVTKNTPVLKVTPKAAAGKNYKITVTVFSKKGKKLKAISKKATIYAQTTSVTITPVTGAAITGASINVTGASIQVGTSITLTAAKTPEKNTKKITWKTSDAKVASVANGVVTAVGAGKATITATSGKASASYEVTVDDSNIAAKIVASGSKQAAADKITLAFDKSAKTLTREDLTVQREDKTEVIPAEAITFSEDGKTATVKLTKALTDKVKYVVSQAKDADTFAFEAQVGAPASFLFKTSTAEKGAKTPVEYSILDATGMDVTAAVTDRNNVVSVDFEEGSASSVDDYSFDSVDDLWIKMGTVDKKATLVFKYEKDKDKFEGKVTIVCIKASEKKGTAMYVSTSDINTTSECAEFYKKTTTPEAIKVKVNKEDSNVYFTAVDEQTHMGIKYDEYVAEVADKKIADVTVDKADGTYAKLTVSGIKDGNTVINVKATLNGASTQYTIPVVIQKECVLTSVKVDVTRKTMTNAYDDLYYSKVTAEAYDQYGDKMTDDSTFTLSLKDKDFGDDALDIDGIPAEKKGFIAEDNPNGHEWYITAAGAKKGSYNLVVTAEHESDKAKEGKASITVEQLGDDVWADPDLLLPNEKTVTYEVEYLDGKSTLAIKNDGNGIKGEDETALLAAKVGSKFVGYVRKFDNETVIGNVRFDGVEVDGEAVTGEAIYAGGITFSAISAAAVNNGDKIEIKSGRDNGVAASAGVKSGVAFSVVAYDATAASINVLSGANIFVVSGGKIQNGDDAVLGQYSDDNDHIVVSGADIYVMVGASTHATSAGSVGTIVKDIWDTVVPVNSDSAIVAYDEPGCISGAVVEATVESVSKDTAFTEAKEVVDVVTAPAIGSYTFTYDPCQTVASNAALYNAKDGIYLLAESDVDDAYMYDATIYVTGKNDGVYGRLGTVDPDAKSYIVDIHTGVSRDKKYSDGALYDYKGNFASGKLFERETYSDIFDEDGADVVSIKITSVDYDEDMKHVDSTSANYDRYFARPTTYQVEFGYRVASDVLSGIDKEKVTKKSISVTNSLYIPKVYVPKLSLKDVDYTTVKEALLTSVDMNNDDEFYGSVTGFYNIKNGSIEDSAPNSAGTSFPVKYVGVYLNGVEYLVNVDQNFTKS